jgi:hypothetical protein
MEVAEEPIMYMLLWFAALFVVAEGFKKLKIQDERVNALLDQDNNLELLKRHRNKIFHYQEKFVHPYITDFLLMPGMSAWVNSLHQEIRRYFYLRSPLFKDLDG